MARTMQPRCRLSLLLRAALFVMSGCVIPIGPKFEDEPNHPPYIVDSKPLIGEEVLGPPNDPTFTVTIADPNIHDVLFVRWIYDYPKYDVDRSRIADPRRIEPTGTVVRGLIPPFEPNCLIHSVARGFPRYRLTLVVADRDFIEGPMDAPLDAVPDGTNRVYASWSLIMECR